MTRRTARDLIVLAAIAALVIGLNLLFLSRGSDTQEDELTGDRSSYSSRAYGTKAYFTFLKNTGIAATRSDASLTSIGGRRDVAAIFSIEPASAWSAQESASLARWVKEGGRLVLIGRRLRWPFSDDSPRVTAEPRKWSVPRVLLPSPLTSGLRNVQLTKHAAGLEWEGGPGVAHLGDSFGVLLWDVRYGDGQVILLGEPYIVANNGISSADNLVLASNLASGLRPGSVLFDEYHHGYAGTEPGPPGAATTLVGLWHYVARTPARFVVIQVALILALVIYSKSRRFGRARRRRRTDRASAYEYVASFAALLEAMHARTLALENIYRGFLTILRKTAGVRGDALLPENLELLSRRSGLPLNRLETAFQECQEAFRNDRVTDEQLLHLVREVRTVEAAIGPRQHLTGRTP